jgi:alpha 1,2-mannosyltransferase
MSSLKEGSSVIGKRDIDVSSQALPLEASLRERLDVWRDAPGGRGDIMGEIEPGQFTQWNLEVSILTGVWF